MENLSLSLTFAILSMLGFGVVDLLAFLLAKNSPAKIIAFWSILLTVIFLGICLLFFPLELPSTFELILLVISGVIGVIALLSFYAGLKKGEIVTVVPIASAWPAIAVFIGIIFLNEALTTNQIAGVSLAIIGTILVSFKLSDISKMKLNRAALGVEYALVTMFGWSIFYTIVGFLSKTIGWYLSSLYSQLAVFLVLALFMLLSGNEASFPSKVKGKLLMYSILITISFVLYSLSTSIGYIAISAPISGAAPFVTILLGVFLLKDKVEKGQLLGVLLIITGIVLVSV